VDDMNIIIYAAVRQLQVHVNVMFTFEALAERNVGSSIQQLDLFVLFISV
jgi:hypothetical protein